MKFGFFFQLPCAPWQSDQERYRDTLAQIKHGDHLGFDTAWLAELHFFPEFSVMSSPLIVAAAAAQHTQRIRLGMAVSLLLLNNPIRSIERTRWLQHEFHLSELICWFNPRGLMPHQTVLASMSRFAAHIMPNLR
jgi:hypothetical protein